MKITTTIFGLLTAAALTLVPLMNNDAIASSHGDDMDKDKMYETEKRFSSPQELSVPESVLYDSRRDIMYAANINGKPLDKDGNGFISVLALDGRIMTLKWVGGMNAPKGMFLANGRLYVADIDQLVEIDPESGSITNRYEAEGAVFLNDVTADDDGNVYVSDYSEENSAIYRLSDGELAVWLTSEELYRPNGLFYEDGMIVTGQANGEIKKIRINDKMIQSFGDVKPYMKGVDGIGIMRDGNYIMSDWAGNVVVVDRKSGNVIQKVLSTADQKINAADITFVPKENLLLVPTFFDNRITGYEIERED